MIFLEVKRFERDDESQVPWMEKFRSVFPFEQFIILFLRYIKLMKRSACLGTVVGKILDWLLGRSQKERDGAIFYFKSLLFLIFIVILVSDKFWNMSSSIMNLLNANVVRYIFEISCIGIHFFTSLAIISSVVLFVAAIICLIIKKVERFEKYEDYFVRMRIGAEFRLKYSVEDILLFLLIAYIFDKSILKNYIDIYADFIVWVLGIICVFQFLTSSVVGILNRFFMLKHYDEKEK